MIPSVTIPTVSPILLSKYGLSTNSANAAANTVAMQLATTHAIATRAPIVDDLPAGGTYVYAKTGANPYYGAWSYCVDIGDGTTGFQFFGKRSVTHGLAANQQTGTTNHCSLFVGRNLKQCYITGKFDGGSLTQSGWTGGYQQGLGTFSIHSSSAGGGCHDVIFEDCQINNSMGCPINIGTIPVSVRRLNGLMLFKNVSFTTFGEGLQTHDWQRVLYHDCHADNTANTSIGDFFEPSRSEWFELVRCTGTSPVSALLGSWVDAFGSVAGKLQDCVFIGGNDMLGVQASEGTVKRIDVNNCTFVDIPIISALTDKTTLRFKDCSFKNCGSVAANMFQVGALNGGGTSDIGSVLEFDGGHADGCYPISVTRNGTLKIRNKTLFTNSVSDAVVVSRSDSSLPVLDLDMICRNPVGAAISIGGGGTAFAPKGSIRGTFSGAASNRQFVATSSGSFENLVMDCDVPDDSPSIFAHGDAAGYKQFIDPTYDPGQYPATSFVGSKGQRIILAGRLASRETTASARWNLVTSPFTISATSTLEMEHVGAGVWREVRRVVGVAA